MVLRVGMPEPSFHVTDPRVLRALAHPLRQRLIWRLSVRNYGARHRPRQDHRRTREARSAITCEHSPASGIVEEAPELARDTRDRVWRMAHPGGSLRRSGLAGGRHARRGAARLDPRHSCTSESPAGRERGPQRIPRSRPAHQGRGAEHVPGDRRDPRALAPPWRREGRGRSRHREGPRSPPHRAARGKSLCALAEAP